VATNTYETVIIAQPDVANDQVDQLINKFKTTLGSHGGSLTAEDRWGRRRLAYAIQGHREGFYSVITFSAEPTVVSALDHLFNVTDSVIRHMTTRVIKSKKTFAPRRERPAGSADSRSSRSGPSSRPRSDAPAHAAAAPAASGAAPSPAAPAAAPAPETPATPAEGSQPA